MERLTSPLPGLVDLPEELLLLLAADYLDSNGRDVVNFSHTCSMIYAVLSRSPMWQRLFRLDKLVQDFAVGNYAKALNDGDSRREEKLNYLLHRRVRHNWRTGRCHDHHIELNDFSRTGHDDKHLVLLDQVFPDGFGTNCAEGKDSGGAGSSTVWFRVRVWDVSGRSLVPVINMNLWSIRLRTEFDLFLGPILVAKGVAVLCFSGKGTDTPQEIVACDIPDGFTELWRDAVLDWGFYELPRLFGDSIYKFNLLADRIEVYDITTCRKKHNIVLVEDMRYPSGEISGDGVHLAVPGKMSVDNSPAVSVWNVVTGSQRFLTPNIPLCPYRYFERTAVSNGEVFGLLNRRCLFIWRADTGFCLRRLELTGVQPYGQEEVPFTLPPFLAVSETLVVTIHKDPCIVNVFDRSGNHLHALETAASDARVVDAHANVNCLLVRSLKLRSPEFQLSVYPLSLRDDRQLEGGNKGAAVVNLAVTDTTILPIGLTSTKVISVTRNELLVRDFLHPAKER